MKLDFELGSQMSAYWDTFLVSRGRLVRLWSIFLRATDPPKSVTLTIPDFPPIGTSRFFTGLRTEHGFPCTYWETVHTGPPEFTPSAGELQELLRAHVP
ncbi:MAG: hypothetical protein ACE5GH_06525 [Fidelibacterota bacterium]